MTLLADSDNALAWFPDPKQRKVIECLAIGYSQNRASQLCDVPQRTISSWWSELSFSVHFRQMVAERAAELVAYRDDIHQQQVAMAQIVFHKGLSGEPVSDTELDSATRILGATYWRQIAGGHKAFGAS